MVEPPRQPLIGAVFEINDRVLVGIQLLAIKGVIRAMHRGRVKKGGIGVNLGAVKFRKDGGRRDSVETIAVIEYSEVHRQTFKARGRVGLSQDGDGFRTNREV